LVVSTLPIKPGVSLDLVLVDGDTCAFDAEILAIPLVADQLLRIVLDPLRESVMIGSRSLVRSSALLGNEAHDVALVFTKTSLTWSGSLSLEVAPSGRTSR